MLRIRKDDTVVVLAGRDKGKSGKVLRVLPKESRVVVEGVNTVKRHTRARPGQPGGVVEKALAIHWSNVALQDPKDGKPTRIGFKSVDGRKLRFAKRSGEMIDR